MTEQDITTRNGKHESGIQRTKLPVLAYASGTGDAEASFSHPVREILISNDSTTVDLTLMVNTEAGSMDMTLLAGEVLDERFFPFNSIAIVSAGAWRYWVRSGRLT